VKWTTDLHIVPGVPPESSFASDAWMSHRVLTNYGVNSPSLSSYLSELYLDSSCHECTEQRGVEEHTQSALVAGVFFR
jgi:hypothetical protein